MIENVVTVLGAFLIVSGIIQVFVQMRSMDRSQPTLTQGADFKPTGFTFKSAYPGMGMIFLGALLLLSVLAIS